MGWIDSTLDSTRDLLRQVFGKDRESREAALSPSVEAEKHLPANITSTWGREDVGGLLSVSQNLMDRFADYESMDEYPDINCLDGCTLIFTLEYGWAYIKDLAATSKDFHVLAYDKDRKALVPALARNARITAFAGHSKQMVKVILDNGASINCTSDHLFMKRDGSWIEAGKLQSTDRLMPGDLRMNFLSRTAKKENYWEVHQPEWESSFRASDGKLWMWLHRLVAQEYFKIGYGDIVHHIDGNPLNNAPSNISIEDPKTHGQKHGRGGKVRKSTPPGWNENRRILSSEQNKLKNNGTKKPIKSKGILSEKHKELISKANSKPITKEQIVSAIEETSSIKKAAELLGISKSTITRRLTKYNTSISEIIRNKLETTPSNHRVVRVELLDESPDVYDLEVPVYHNFVANGVVVHNCFAEGSLVYVTDGSMMKPMAIEQLAFDEPELQILAFDRDKSKIVKVPAIAPRLTGVCEPVIKIQLSNKSSLRVTKDHKVLHREKGYVNADTLQVGDELVSMYSGFNPKGMGMLVHHTPGYITVTENPVPDGSCRVFDVTTSTHNLIVNGVVCHNSAFHYFANDATQPDIDSGKTIWVHCKDDAIKAASETLLHKRLRLEDEIWSIAYTLSKYGNDYEEILVAPDGSGVVGLNFLPAPTIRRIERADGALIGFVQDVTGKFTEDAKNLRAYLAGKGQVPDHVAVFEDWQVCHMRLRSSHRRSPYGFSVADGARWIWKRLVLLEDAVMIYKLCLRGDSQVWTPKGQKAIKDLTIDDDIYCYTNDDKLKKTRVVYKKHNGKDTIYKIRSNHRELFANKTHPVLVEWTEHFGKGNAKVRHAEFVEVQNLIPGKHSFFLPRKNEDDWEDIQLLKPELVRKARLKKESIANGITPTIPLTVTSAKAGIRVTDIDKFFNGKHDIVEESAIAVLDCNGYGCEHLEVEESWGGRVGPPIYGINVPNVVDEEFARWFGFMLGDGFITTRHHSDGYVACNQVGFARGSDEEINKQYKTIFEKYVGKNLDFVGDSNGRLGAYALYSVKFAEFMKFNGFIPGAENKRLPEWVFRASPKVKLALLKGLIDADGHYRKKGGRVTIELCNKALLDDVRELAMQLGLIVCLVRKRNRKGGHVIDKKTNRIMPDTVSYTLDFYFKQAPLSEKIVSITPTTVEDIWDIGVEADEHNFIANGVPVSNTRAPARFAFYIDVTDIPSDKVELFLKQAKDRLKKKQIVNPRTQRLDMRYNPLCVTGDTKIPLLDGSEKTILELVKDHESGKQNWTYSIDREDGNKIVPGKISWAGKTRENASLVKVTLDNGKSIRVTPDHKMMLRSGEYIEAKDLVAGDLMMSLYPNDHKVTSVDRLAYTEDTYCITIDVTHNFATSCGIFIKNSMDEDFFLAVRDGKQLARIDLLAGPNYQCLTGDTKIPLLNGTSPTIKEMADKGGEYWLYSCTEKGKIVPGKAYAPRMSSPSAQIWEVGLDNGEVVKCTFNHPFLTRDGKWVLARDLQPGQTLMPFNRRVTSKKDGDFSDGYEQVYDPASEKYVYTHRRVHNHIIDKADTYVKGTVIHHKNGKKDNSPESLIRITASEHRQLHQEDVKKMQKLATYHNEPVFDPIECETSNSDEVGYMNHKVTYVKQTDRFEPVYDLTVEGTHCFAVNSGVLLHNSMEDVDYFKRMLHGTLKVPRSYLGQDGPVMNKGLLSNEDVRAARVTLGLQRELRNGISRIIHVDLAARGIDPWKIPFTVNMTVPSGIYELAQREVQNARADFASRMMPFVSMDWIRRHVFKLTEEEIAVIEKEARQDQEKQLELQFKAQKGMMDLQMQAQASQQQALGGTPGEMPPETPAPMMHPGMADLPRTSLDWKNYDSAKRLEEMRERKTRERLSELEDKFDEFMQKDSLFKQRILNKREFLNDFKEAALVNNNGFLNGVPTGNGVGRHPSN